MDKGFLKKLRLLSLVEGISTLALFGIAMPLKYLKGLPIAVSIVGPIHGALFTALAAMFVLGIQRVPMSRALSGLGIVAAVFPFGPFLFDHRLKALECSS